ncbi:MAG: PLDc N-terminal domain-containing protein [Ardenticatenaceae bacterium]
MEYLGFSLPFFLAVVINFVLLFFFLSWVPLSIYALVQLRRLRIPEIARVLWAVLIITIPYLGAIALLIVKPDEAREPY